MTTQKLYALRTIPAPGEKGEWVIKSNGDLLVTNNTHSHNFEKEIISLDLSTPCEWVEVYVVEVKPVDNVTILDMNPYKSDSQDHVSFFTSIAWENGFRACIRYLGVTE